MKHIVPISGKDSLATAIVQSTFEPNLDYEYFFTDTGLELPETYEWIRQVENKQGWNIKRVGSNLDEITRQQGILPSARVRFCTRLSKIKPMEEYIGFEPAFVYYGIRYDEQRLGYVPFAGSSITPKYPLVDKKLNLSAVWTILEVRGLKPPSFFWPQLYERVVDRIGVEKVESLSSMNKHFLFAGRSRSNCYKCWGQRQYEVCWLYDTHPDLYEEACSFEKEIGGGNFHIIKEKWLFEIVENYEQVINRRVNEVSKIINSLADSTVVITEDQLTRTSCGLLCGK